ncbi:hypothetical protein [Streptomyces sp. NPDC057677]|uniref:hypothetical protein n=1 Tax=unclassified Streptomyces TaxID=2593676 RepID=UPI0036CEEE49
MTTSPEDTATVAERRATVARRRAAGLSLREIAAELGTTKDTVHRDVQALSRDTATLSDQERRAPVAPDILTVALPTATPATGPATASRDTATPAAPYLTVPLDASLLADLSTLTANGATAEDAVRQALAHFAKGYRLAWGIGLYPHTVDPVISRPRFNPYQPAPDATHGTPSPTGWT